MKHINKKHFLFTLFLVFIFFSVNAQDSDKFWFKTTALKKSATKKIERKSIPSHFDVFELNLNSLKTNLVNAPLRKGKLTTSSTVLSFPNENGELEKYQIFEAPIMEESLQKKYPTIKSYVGKGIDNPNSIARLSVTSLGLHAMISQKSGEMLYIDPYTLNKETYISYKKKSLPVPEQFECKVDEYTKVTNTNPSNTVAKTDNANDGILRTFRLAVATTGEYSQFHLNNQGISATATDAVKKTAVLSAIAAIITRVNSVYERDVALTMVLVANNTDIIFFDAATDGFTNSDGGVLIDESQTVIDDVIGFDNYDIGHTFSTGGGGLAQLRSPCTSSKARGITGLNSPIGDPYAIDYVAHEMGHQYGANHTFNTDAGGCGGGNRNSGTAIEPGSGSTIMAYAGLCSPQNVQDFSDAYFHLVSIREMWANVFSGNSTCGAQTSASNSSPTIDVLSNYTIPILTPFILNANASDIDGDDLTYTWEQLDTEIAPHPLVSTATGGPAFRSLSPTSSSKRYFPAQSTVIAGNLSTTWEVLPSVSRTMQFGVTVRDNHLPGGQTASEETTLTVDGNSGPFKVTSQISAVVWDAGTAQTITWDVANTNVSPVNCSFVNILFSEDGGVTYPITLAENVANNGSYEIVVPSNATSSARVKVESVGNVFYAINETNITIQTSEFIMNFVSNNEAICSPNNVVYTFTYNTFLDFNEETTFSALNNPAGTTVSFVPNTATADNTTVQMTVSGILNENVGNYTISVIGTSAPTTKNTVVNLDVYSSTINAPTLVTPLNNATSVLKPYTLSWNLDVNALNYTVQISTDNTFSTVNESANVNVNFYTPSTLLINTNYFWRVKSINACGESVFSSVNSFTTANETCESSASSDTPLGIPDNNTTGISSIINVADNKFITDINVTVNITHPWIGDLTLTLTSPQGTSVILAANRTDEGDNYTNTVFDSDALDLLSSGVAPYTGTFIPQGNLANFNNEESIGNWTLKVVDGGAQDIGTINNWTIEICGVNLPSDSDSDGVDNADDVCPNTPTGETVNADGCSDSQLDDDGDGIMNNLDLCSATPIGEAVNADGCGESQLDEDSDGVMNNLDICPNTPTGETVNADGCSDSQLDDDGDGIQNGLDICSATPIGETVNSDGCGESQLDEDSDGVMNNLDICPNTQIGETVNADGCSDGQLDDDGDGIQNGLDICSDTPVGETVNSDGCGESQLDEDSDGVMNNLDICPNTPTGETVNADGCSDSQLDDDGDGIQNGLDVCSATPIGETVNSDGCGESQLDEDSDGVMNNLDICSNTPTGESVNADGCSDSQLDDDGDGIQNGLDICSDTPVGETANSDGCGESQLDEDSDGVMNNLDICLNTPIGEMVNADGCSDSQLDDDGDGVMNNKDLCDNTPVGATVDDTGCLVLSPDNFNIEIISETCPDKDNGQIIITANEIHNYTTIINEPYSFNTGLTVSNLTPGTYNFCILIEGETYEQCFVVEIIEGTTVLGKLSIASGKAAIEIEQGTAPFNIFVNGVQLFETNSSVFSVAIKHGDVVEVKTAVACEGVYSKSINLIEDIIAYPNPTNSTFKIALPVLENEVLIDLYSIHSQLISRKTYPIMGGGVQLSLENQPTGLYIVKVYLEIPVILKILKK